MLQSAYLLNCIQEFMFASTDVYLHLVRYQPVKGYGGLKKTPISLVESMLCHVRSTLKDPTSYFHWCLSPKNQSYKTSQPGDINIVGEGVHTPPPPFSKIPPFLEIQYVPIFHRPIGKPKVLNDSFNRFVYKFYTQSILILEEYLLKWWNANFI